MKYLHFLFALLLLPGGCSTDDLDFSTYPSVEISNDQVKMKIFLPDPGNGLYRATRFDWSGVIGSARYKGHDYFGYWKKTQDPLFHEDLPGPVEGYIEPGPGYSEAEPGNGFIRIGVGTLEKENETEYNWRKTYRFLDHGEWSVDHGADWITFTHRLNTDFGYAYTYSKTIRLKKDGFTLHHTLENRGTLPIETDQFNHNFLVIDGEHSGRAFTIEFPYAITTESDLKGLLEIRDRELAFISDLEEPDSVFVVLEGYGPDPADHRVTVINHHTGAGVTYTVDQPLYRMAFWACISTLSPENSLWIRVEPGHAMNWNSDYTLFTL